MWLNDQRLILPDTILERGSLRIENGLIAEIIEGPVDGLAKPSHRLTVMPGLVDIHGDMVEREVEPRPKTEFPVDLGLLELDKRLASNGITTAFAAISLNWNTQNVLRKAERARDLIARIIALRPILQVDHRIHARFEITEPEAAPLLEKMLQAQHVHLVSVNDHTPGQGQYRDIEAYIETIRDWNAQISGEIRTEAEIRQEIVAQQQNSPRSWQIATDIARVSRQHGVMLASHDDDTAARIELVSELGVRISEFPVTLEAAQAAKARGLFTAMGAPNAFRGYSHSNNLSAVEAIRAGVVDILAADYHPPSMLHAVYALVRQQILSLPEAVRLVTDNPAQAVGLTERGRLQVGMSADLVLVAETPYPRVRGTLREGRLIYGESVAMFRMFNEVFTTH